MSDEQPHQHTSQEDLAELLNFLVGFAQYMLRQSGQFLPFASVVTYGGEVRPILSLPSHEEQTAQQVIHNNLDAMRQLAVKEEIKASGICMDVRITQPKQKVTTDAIQISVEHIDGSALSFFLPYNRVEEGEYDYGQMFAMPGKPSVFA